MFDRKKGANKNEEIELKEGLLIKEKERADSEEEEEEEDEEKPEEEEEQVERSNEILTNTLLNQDDDYVRMEDIAVPETLEEKRKRKEEKKKKKKERRLRREERRLAKREKDVSAFFSNDRVLLKWTRTGIAGLIIFSSDFSRRGRRKI